MRISIEITSVPLGFDAHELCRAIASNCQYSLASVETITFENGPLHASVVIEGCARINASDAGMDF